MVAGVGGQYAEAVPGDHGADEFANFRLVVDHHNCFFAVRGGHDTWILARQVLTHNELTPLIVMILTVFGPGYPIGESA